jgi:hypothetical protein
MGDRPVLGVGITTGQDAAPKSINSFMNSGFFLHRMEGLGEFFSSV